MNQTKIELFVEELLNEGINDPGILKAVFMAGGPASGKSAVAAWLFDVPSDFSWASFSAYGLKIVNSDRPLASITQRLNISLKDLHKLPKEVIAKYRGQAKAATQEMYDLNLRGHLGMILDSTASDMSEISGHKRELEAAGYDTFMVFVNTALEVALARNRARGRQISDEVVREKWDAAQANRSSLASLFGSHFRTVENSREVEKLKDNIGTEIDKAVRYFVNQPVQNPIGREWIDDMLKARQFLQAA